MILDPGFRSGEGEDPMRHHYDETRRATERARAAVLRRAIAWLAGAVAGHRARHRADQAGRQAGPSGSKLL